MQPLAVCGYTAEQVKQALHAASRVLSFRYELLDSQGRKKADLAGVLGGRIEYNSLAEIKRTATFTLEDSAEVNYLSDRIKPWVRLRMPDGGWAEWPQGVFLLTTPPRRVSRAGVVTREVQAYDLLQVLVDDKLADRYTVSVGTNYIAAVKAVLDGAGLTRQNLTPTDKTLPADRDWPPGTKKLSIVNDLLGSINYKSLWIDENGTAVAEPYRSPAERAPEYTYRDDEASVIFPEVGQSLDLFGVPNKWVLVVSQPDRTVLTSTYTNNNPDSPTSTVSRGRAIVDYREVDAADQASLDAMAARIAFEASQVYEQVEFETAIMPFHSDSDVIELHYTKLGIAHKYSEVAWGFDLKAGARMYHRVRRVITV
ncbi:MAG TPA: hypothetical protein GX513_08715 [Firmicutes bacterium]|nr:hypothetical protein [Bacillota bacterium]